MSKKKARGVPGLRVVSNKGERLGGPETLAPIIRGSWRLAMRAHDISRVDGGGCSGTLATRLEVGAGGESGTCRIAHGPQAAIEVARAVKAWTFGYGCGSAILMRVFSSWMRTAILRNAQRMVSKVAVRQIERFGAALLSSCRSQ